MLDMKTRDQVAHRDNEHGQGKHESDPEFARKRLYPGVFCAVSCADCLRFKRHATDRAVARVVRLDFRMHRTGVDRPGQHYRRWLERHSALWAVAGFI